MNSDKVVVLSQFYISEIGKFACKSDNVIVIGNPVTLELEHDNWIKEKTICFIGRLSWQKRPDLLLKIWKRLQYKTDWHLYIVGDGELKPLLESRINAEKIENVSLEGFQDPRAYLRKSQILCMTSAYEGFPLVLFEGMGYGVVPIAFDTFGSAKDIISEGFNGYLIPATNENLYVSKLAELMENRETLQLLKINALSTAKKNTVEEVGEQWLKLFDSLCFARNCK